MKINTIRYLLAVTLACVSLFSACQPISSHNSSVYTEITMLKEKTTISTLGTTTNTKGMPTTHNHKHFKSIYFTTTDQYTTAFCDIHSFADVCALFNEHTTSSRFNEENFEMMLKDRFFLLPAEQETYPYRLDDFSIQFFMGGSISFPLECPHGNKLSISYNCKKGDPYEGQKLEDYLVNKAGQTIRKVHIGSNPRYFWNADGYHCEMDWLSSSGICTEECTRNFFKTVLFKKVYVDQPDNTMHSTTASKTQSSLS